MSSYGQYFQGRIEVGYCSMDKAVSSEHEGRSILILKVAKTLSVFHEHYIILEGTGVKLSFVSMLSLVDY